MRGRHILVIDPAVRNAELDCFNRMAVASPVPLTYHLPALHGMASIRLDEPGAIGIVLLGSSASVNDRLPWQQELADWLLPRMQGGIPTLGICFGHQLIAHLHGAPVAFQFADRHKLVGFETTELAPDRLWGDAQRGALYVSHYEVVTACPKDFAIVATRPSQPFDGFAHRSLPIWTFQAHPEATRGFAQGIDTADDAFAFGHGLVQRFLELAARGRFS